MPAIASSKFFFSDMILRTFMSVPLRFLIPQPAVWQAWIRSASVDPCLSTSRVKYALVCVQVHSPEWLPLDQQSSLAPLAAWRNATCHCLSFHRRMALGRWIKTVKDDCIPERTRYLRDALHSPQ